MKLLNSDEPLHKETEEEDGTDPVQEEPFGLTAKPAPRRPRPLPPSTVAEEPAAEPAAETAAAAPPPLKRPTRPPTRTSGQGIRPRSPLFVTPANPGERLRAVEEAGKSAKPAKLPLRYRMRPDRKKARYAFWDIAAALSLAINAVLIGALLVMARQINTLKQTISGGLLGGLYSSFVDMDKANISTTIRVDAQIPLNFNLPLQQNTTVVLTDNVSIPRAHVVINTPLFNISAPANVTLPSGTNLPIALNMSIPVQATIPVSLQVPVNIPLAGTGLHTPFQGLQQAIRPYYCMLEPDAQYPQGSFICRQTSDANSPTGVP